MPQHGPVDNPHNSPFTAETGIPTDRFGFKTNKLGRGIDDFLASLIGGPQSPQGPDNPEADPVGPISPPIGLPPQPMRGIQAGYDPSRDDPGGTVGQQVEPVTDPLEAFGGGGPDFRTQFPPGSEGPTAPLTQADRTLDVPETEAQIKEGDIAGLNVGPAVPIGRGETPLGPNAQTEARIAGGGMLSPLLMAIWPQIMAMLGRQTAAPVSRQITSRFPTIPTRNALVPYTGGVKPGLTAAGTLSAAAGTNPLLDAITGRDKDALNTQVQ